MQRRRHPSPSPRTADLTVLVSAALFDIITKGRIARAVEDLDTDTLKAIAGSSVGSEHAALDKIVADWTPRR